jgi:hypothetical protein
MGLADSQFAVTWISAGLVSARHKKGPGDVPPGPENAAGCSNYFSEVLIVLKFALSWVPTPCTAVMIAIAIPAAISPYSIAVAPDSSLINLKISVFMFGPALIFDPSEQRVLKSSVSENTEQHLRLFKWTRCNFSGFCGANIPQV